MTEYGSGGELSVTMDGPFVGSGGGSDVKITEVLVPASNWKGAASPYSQNITLEGITVNSIVNIQMSAEQLESLRDRKIAFTVENRGGVCTLFAVGDNPSVDVKIQATISGATVLGEGDGAIRGNTITTSDFRPDYNQEDPARSDFILNKPELVDMLTIQITLQEANWSNNKQTVRVDSVVVSSKQAVITVAAPDDLETYLDCNIRMSERGDGSITFECDDKPGADVAVNALILTKGDNRHG